MSANPKQANPAYVLTGRAEIRLKISPWLQPETCKFQFGSCEGMLMLTPTTYDLVAVVNTRKHNGTFPKLLAHLRALAQQHQRDIVVAEIHSPGLGQHLAQQHGYTLLPGTRHAFLAVAGPGTPPVAYTTPAQAGPFDALLDFLTSHAS